MSWNVGECWRQSPVRCNGERYSAISDSEAAERSKRHVEGTAQYIERPSSQKWMTFFQVKPKDLSKTGDYLSDVEYK